MKLRFVSILAFCIGLVSFSSCDTDVEALEIQKLYLRYICIIV